MTQNHTSHLMGRFTHKGIKYRVHGRYRPCKRPCRAEDVVVDLICIDEGHDPIQADPRLMLAAQDRMMDMLNNPED